MNDQLWEIREPRGSDLKFIYATWLNSYRYDSWAKAVPKSIFFDNYTHVIDHILSDSHILIACKKDEPHVIYGYIIYEPKLAHYVFVKETFRRFGIAKDLFNNAFPEDPHVTISHRTKMLVPIIKERSDLTFNPFILYNKETQ